MERREFIKNCGITCLTGVGLAAFLESCRSLYYAPNTINGNIITVKKTDFGQNKYVLIRNEKLQAPVYLLKVSETEYSAVLMLCTHKGCELNAGGSLLVCPCHGSEFSTTGKVQTSPAERDLQKYIVTTDNESIFINL